MDQLLLNELQSLKDSLESNLDKKVDAKIEALQKHLDILDVKAQQSTMIEQKPKGLVNDLKATFTKNEQSIKDNNAVLKIKAVTTGSVTGTGENYFGAPYLKPNSLVNVSDLIVGVQVFGGAYSYATEVVTGTPAIQVETEQKSNLDIAFTYHVVETAFLAGVCKVSKQFLNNYTSLAQQIPPILTREYYKAENTLYSAELFSKASASTITTGSKIERLVNEIAQLMGKNIKPTYAVVNPVDYADILLTKSATSGEYDIPEAVVFDTNGTAIIMGVPLVMADWVAVDAYIVFNGGKVIDCIQEGMNLVSDASQYFDSNQVVFRVEKQSQIAITAPAECVKGTFTQASV